MRESSIETSIVGHSSHQSNYQELSRKMTAKIRRNVLMGRFSPEPRDRSMILAFRNQDKSVDEFLKEWKD
tara:strand:+ start:256 stop:465 length:210 start_codon:yes stop_codon:yes gene_type:complete